MYGRGDPVHLNIRACHYEIRSASNHISARRKYHTTWKFLEVSVWFPFSRCLVKSWYLFNDKLPEKNGIYKTSEAVALFKSVYVSCPNKIYSMFQALIPIKEGMTLIYQVWFILPVLQSKVDPNQSEICVFFEIAIVTFLLIFLLKWKL